VWTESDEIYKDNREEVRKSILKMVCNRFQVSVQRTDCFNHLLILT
jgi:hypothetical protein